jgi:predicted enzyme related to lactoylglutathione lyase
LGHVAVDDVPATVARAVAAGAQPLPAPQPGSALLRDRFGATVALSPPPEASGSTEVKWHVLASRDQDEAFGWYSQIFGWSETGVMQLESAVDCRTFAWDNSDRSVGSTTNAARLSGVHPHWLFHFVVDDIADSVELVRRRGGKVVGPSRTSRGDLVAACDDPQGAAFGLIQRTVG